MRDLIRIVSMIVASAFAVDRAAAQSPQTATPPSSAFFTASDGVKIHYLTLGGAGSWVVLVHGFGDTADRMWFQSGVAAALARDHRVLALDNRNHGKSDAPRPGASGRPDDVIELMDHLKIDKAHIHGYSMGGGMTAWLLLTHPARFLSAAFGGSGIFETDETLAAQATALDKPVVLPANPPAWLKQLLELDAARMKTIQFAPVDLTRVTIPVMAITGELDRPAWRTQRMWRQLRDFRSVVLAGRNHLTAIGVGAPMPPEYADALVTFVRAHDR
jgi:pimeloyl-ACP methyl ester carboxylesterase